MFIVKGANKCTFIMICERLYINICKISVWINKSKILANDEILKEFY